MDIQTRIEIIEHYYANGKSASAAQRSYNKKHGRHNNAFALSTIIRLVERFERTGSVHDMPKSGRPNLQEKRASFVKTALEQLQSENSHGIASSSQVAVTCAVPRASCYRILRRSLNLYPYRIQTSQKLSETNKKSRIEFANFILNGGIDLESIIWSDESYFSISGQVYRHNSIIWGTERPKITYEIDRHSPKICVWFAYSAKFRLTPFFFPDTVTGENYAAMLKKHVIPELRKRRLLDKAIFQQDGAPPHFSKVARETISSVFPDHKVIARGYPQNWPAYSPDLSPLDYYLWCTVKSRVYHNWCGKSLEELKDRIQSVLSDTDQDELQRSVSNLRKRLQSVLDSGGCAVDNLM